MEGHEPAPDGEVVEGHEPGPDGEVEGHEPAPHGEVVEGHEPARDVVPWKDPSISPVRRTKMYLDQARKLWDFLSKHVMAQCELGGGYSFESGPGCYATALGARSCSKQSQGFLASKRSRKGKRKGERSWGSRLES